MKQGLGYVTSLFWENIHSEGTSNRHSLIQVFLSLYLSLTVLSLLFSLSHSLTMLTYRIDRPKDICSILLLSLSLSLPLSLSLSLHSSSFLLILPFSILFLLSPNLFWISQTYQCLYRKEMSREANMGQNCLNYETHFVNFEKEWGK